VTGVTMGLTRTSGVVLLVLLAGGAGAEGPSASERGDVPPDPPECVEARVLERFQAREDEPVGSFRARRRLRAEGLGRRASMDVLVELDPEGRFRWTIEAEDGSKLIRNKAFRPILEKEAAIRGAEAEGTALTAENYDLRTAGRESDGLIRLRAIPRRRGPGLLDGTLVVTPDDADLVRIEGRLVRNPSIWITRVEVVRHFRRLRGHRVVVRIEAVAHVRLLGDVRTTIDFDYEMIDGDPIGPAVDPVPRSPVATTEVPPATPGGTRSDS